jgi:hypothetical protein
MQKMMYLLVSQHVSGIIMPIIRRMVVGYLFAFMIQDARSHEIKIILYGPQSVINFGCKNCKTKLIRLSWYLLLIRNEC